jgi:hypothetical protein
MMSGGKGKNELSAKATAASAHGASGFAYSDIVQL